MSMFIDPPGFTGKVRPGVPTPPYEAAYRKRWRQQVELGEVQTFTPTRDSDLSPSRVDRLKAAVVGDCQSI